MVVPNEPSLSVDRTSGLPIYLQLKYQIINDISMGRLVAGQALPSIRQAAKSLGVTPTTIRHAYDSLADDGFVVGLPGKGVVVTELAPAPQAEAVRRQDALSDLLRPTVMQALGLGYAPSEIQAAVTRSLTEGDREPTILFVGAEPEFIEYYTPLVADAVRDLHVTVDSMPLARLASEGSRSLVPFPLCVVTPVRSFPPVRELLRDVRVAVVALALDLSAETIESLIRIPREARVLLVGEQVNLSGFAYLVHQYVATDEPIGEVVLSNALTAKRLLRADVVIHSLRARAAVARLAPPDSRRLELHFVPNPTSLSQVRQAIQQRLGWRKVGEGERRDAEEVGAVAIGAGHVVPSLIR
jgi:GntR family transcriptional regulator